METRKQVFHKLQNRQNSISLTMPGLPARLQAEPQDNLMVQDIQRAGGKTQSLKKR